MKIDELYSYFKECEGVSTDTRRISPGSLFFALKGPRFDANRFAAEALEKGARYAVVDDATAARGPRYLVVDDSLKALQLMARHHRDQFTIPVIGLTGSNGKTTSKELIHTVLSRKFRTLATQGNLNNHIGVPLTVLSITGSTQIAVIEMGANRLGDIALLCRIADPDHGLITNIGKAHIGTFGGFDNVIRGKSELYQHLILRDGVVWINSADPILTNMARRFRRPLFYPKAGNFYHAELISADPYVRFRAENGQEVQTLLLGAYNFENIAAALCIGKYFGVEPALANEAVAGYAPGNMRSQVIVRGTNTIILDAYNANPSSMEAALHNLKNMEGGRRIAILGDMYELEGEAPAEHEGVARLAAGLDIDEVLLCGELFAVARPVVPSARYFDSKEALAGYLKANSPDHSIILVKASRGMGLESVLDVLP
jgi:UDP-N-acetylmuramoyl-tripeptide--D-alanyl-D-alanine ligase